MKHIDKLKHLGCFTGATVVALLLLGQVLPSVLPELRIGIVSFGVAVAAFLTEDAQRHQEGRVKDGWDAFADMVAVPLGIFGYLAVRHFLQLQGVL